MKKLTILLFSCFLSGFGSYAQDFRMGPVTGAVTHQSSKIFAALSAPGQVKLDYAADSLFLTQQSVTESSVQAPYNRVFFQLQNLQPSTKYFFKIYRNANPTDTLIGSFSTFPIPGETKDFTFTFGSCQKGSPMHDLFSNMLMDKPAFFLQLGDYTYPDGKYGTAYPIIDSVVDASYIDRFRYEGMVPLLNTTPIDYVYDDHDYTRNNSGRTTFSRDSTFQGINGIETVLMEKPLLPGARRGAIEGYVNYFPSYQLPDTSEGLYHSFRYGQAEFFFVDNRSNRTPNHYAFTYDSSEALLPWSFDPPQGHTILGNQQLQWLLNGLLQSDATWKFIVSGTTFNKSIRRLIDVGISLQRISMTLEGNSGTGMTLAAGFSDAWPGFPEDQNQLLDFIEQNNLKNVIILTGDTHTSAMDDGTNSGIPEFNCSDLEVNPNSIRLYRLVDSVGAILGQPSVMDSMWNRGGAGLGNNNFNPSYGRIQVFGKDSARLCIVDKFGVAFNCWTFTEGYKAGQNTSFLDRLIDNPKVTLYPNPATNQVHIELDAVLIPGLPIQIQVINFLGQVFSTTVVFPNSQTKNRFTISVENLSKGYYLVALTQGNNRWNKQFFKKDSN